MKMSRCKIFCKFYDNKYVNSYSFYKLSCADLEEAEQLITMRREAVLQFGFE